MGTTKDDEDDQRELTKGSRTGDDRSATKNGFVKLKHQLYK